MLKDKFKKLREKAGISQQEVATKSGLSWSLIAQIEQGKKNDVRVSTLLGIAKALGVDSDSVGIRVLALATDAGALHFEHIGSVDLLAKIRRHGTQ